MKKYFYIFVLEMCATISLLSMNHEQVQKNKNKNFDGSKIKQFWFLKDNGEYYSYSKTTNIYTE